MEYFLLFYVLEIWSRILCEIPIGLSVYLCLLFKETWNGCEGLLQQKAQKWLPRNAENDEKWMIAIENEAAISSGSILLQAFGVNKL